MKAALVALKLSLHSFFLSVPLWRRLALHGTKANIPFMGNWFEKRFPEFNWELNNSGDSFGTGRHGIMEHGEHGKEHTPHTWELCTLPLLREAGAEHVEWLPTSTVHSRQASTTCHSSIVMNWEWDQLDMSHLKRNGGGSDRTRSVILPELLCPERDKGAERRAASPSQNCVPSKVNSTLLFCFIFLFSICNYHILHFVSLVYCLSLILEWNLYESRDFVCFVLKQDLTI
jgi:hypothetical protein